MSNYLNQLVAKNLDLIDTVQPFLLSVFGFLPDSPVEMGSGESWGINQEIVMGGGGDSTLTTELETSPEAQTLTNSDMVQPLEWRSLATQLPTSGDINNLPSTGLTPTPNRYSEQPPTATSFLADKSDSVSSSQPFPQPVEILPTTDKIPPTPNIQSFSSSSESGQFTQKGSEAISSPGVPKTQTVTESEEAQPVETDDAVSRTQSPKVVSSSPSPTQLKSEPVTRESKTDKVLPTKETQQLTSAPGEKTNTSLLEPTVKSQEQSVPFVSKQPEVEINRLVSSSPSSKVIREELSSHQGPPQSVASAPASSEVLGALNTQPLMPGLTGEANTGSPYPAVEQLTRTATESKGLQPVETDDAVSRTQSPKVVSYSQSLTPPKSEPEPLEPTSDKVLPTLQRQPLTSAQPLKTNTPLSEPTVIRQEQSVPFLSKQPEDGINRLVPSSPSSKEIREKLSSHQGPPLSVAMNPSRSEVLGALDKQSLMPRLTVETNTGSPPTAVEKLTRTVTESEEAQPVETYETVSRTQSLKVVSSQPSPTQFKSEPVTREPTTAQVPPTKETQQLTSALSVEAITPLSEPTGIIQEQSVPFLSKQPEAKINRLVSDSPSSKVMREQLASHQGPPPSVAIAPAIGLGALNKQPLMPGLRVETNTAFPPSGGEQLTQPVTESKGLQPVRIHETDSLSQSPKVFSSEQSLAQSLPEPVPIKRTSDKVLTQGIVTVKPTSNFLDRPPLPNPNILQPINEDTRRGSAVISTSKQKPQQRESLGNSRTPPTIQVSIGRMEIRTPPPPPPPRPKPRPKPPVMTLDEYLRQRSRGR